MTDREKLKTALTLFEAVRDKAQAHLSKLDSASWRQDMIWRNIMDLAQAVKDLAQATLTLAKSLDGNDNPYGVE